MKLIRFGEKGYEKPGLLIEDRILDIQAAQPAVTDFTAEWFARSEFQQLEQFSRNPDPALLINASGIRLGSPIKNPGKLICLGMNYAAHATEGARKPPESPMLFCKAPTSLNGPFDPVIIPYDDCRADWEVELALVMGKTAKGVKKEDALDFIFGYTILNDVSGRAAQFGDKQWFRGKSFDTFAPLGPMIVTSDEIPDPQNLDLFSKVNGEIQQSGNTRDMIFNIPFLIEFISQGMTLEPGDIISTGTPEGVGAFQDPPRFLKDGDTVETGIQGLGKQRNPITAA